MLVVVGVIVVVAVFVDAFMTTLAVSAGAGPLTSVVLARCWRVLYRVHRQDRESAFLTAAGTVLLTVTVLVWVALLWAGWTLVFSGSGAVAEATTREPAGRADVVYYTGFTVFTLGTGDFVATTPGWRVVTAVASFSGLFLVTLSITYLISVVSAVVNRRALAIQIRALGDSPTQIITNGWVGNRFGDVFQQQLVALTPTVATSAEQHLAYPVLHYFHSPRSTLAAPLAIADLDEALLMLDRAVAPGHRPERSTVRPVRFVIERYLSTAIGTAWTPEVGTPPPPTLDGLRGGTIPCVDDEEFSAVVEADAPHRAALHRLVVSDGWSWRRR